MKLIIFDLDGVLVELRDAHYQALNLALSELGFKEISKDKHYKEFNGLPTRKKLEKLGIPLEDRSKVYDLKQQYTNEAILNLEVDLRLQEVLKKLKQDGLMLTCASNAIRSTVKNSLLQTGLLKYIDFFVSNEDVIHHKPNPETYLRCMIAAGIGPKETVIVEDSSIGVQGAQSAGAEVKRVNNPEEVTYELLS